MKHYLIVNGDRVDVDREVYLAYMISERYEHRLSSKISENETHIDETDIDEVYRDKVIFSIPEYVEAREVLDKVIDIINSSLSEREKHIIESIIFMDHSRCEVAKEMGLTYRQVSYLLNKSLKKIRAIYGKDK